MTTGDDEEEPRRVSSAELLSLVTRTASGGGGGLRGLRDEVAMHDASPADRTRLQGLLDCYLMTSTVTL